MKPTALDQDNYLEEIIQKCLQKYQEAIETLENTLKHPELRPPSAEQFLNLFQTRQELQAEIKKLQDNFKQNSTINRRQLYLAINQRLRELDNRIREQIDDIERLTRLANWQNRPNLPIAAWSWFLDTLPQHWQRINAICSFVSLVLLSVSFSYGVDISKRFINDGVDELGTTTIVLQSLVTLLIGGSILSKSLQETIVKTFDLILPHIKITKKWGYVLGLVLSFSVLLFCIGFYSFLPHFSSFYNERGESAFVDRRFGSAESNYKRAIQLNPDNAKAHYNLGVFYEEIQQIKLAIDEYQLAVKGEYVEAYRKLAKLSASKQNYSEAASWLLKDLRGSTINDNKSTKERNFLIDKLAKFYIKDENYDELQRWLAEVAEANIARQNKFFAIEARQNKFFAIEARQSSFFAIEKSTVLASISKEDYDNAKAKLEQILSESQNGSIKISADDKRLTECLLEKVKVRIGDRTENLDIFGKCQTFRYSSKSDANRWFQKPNNNRRNKYEF